MSEHGGHRREGRDDLKHVLLELENLIYRQADSKTPRRRLLLTKFPIVLMSLGAAAVAGVVIAFSGGTSSAPPSHAAEVEGDGSVTVASALHSLTEQTGERSSNQASISNPLAKAASTPVGTYVEALGYRSDAPPRPPSPTHLSRPDLRGPEPNSKAPETSPSNVALQQADRVDPPSIDPAHAAMLQKRADQMLASGDLSAARLILGRLAETGNGRAAYELAQTYDPAFLRQVGSIGLTSDIARARSWYEKARDLGFAPATERLQALASSASPTVGRRQDQPQLRLAALSIRTAPAQEESL